MPNHPVVLKRDWIAARMELLTREKKLTHQRDELAQLRRALPGHAEWGLSLFGSTAKKS